MIPIEAICFKENLYLFFKMPDITEDVESASICKENKYIVLEYRANEECALIRRYDM